MSKLLSALLVIILVLTPVLSMAADGMSWTLSFSIPDMEISEKYANRGVLDLLDILKIELFYTDTRLDASVFVEDNLAIDFVACIENDTLLIESDGILESPVAITRSQVADAITLYFKNKMLPETGDGDETEFPYSLKINDLLQDPAECVMQYIGEAMQDLTDDVSEHYGIRQMAELFYGVVDDSQIINCQIKVADSDVIAYLQKIEIREELITELEATLTSLFERNTCVLGIAEGMDIPADLPVNVLSSLFDTLYNLYSTYGPASLTLGYNTYGDIVYAALCFTENGEAVCGGTVCIQHSDDYRKMTFRLNTDEKIYKFVAKNP